MILKHFFEPRLAQSSFLVGCETTGQAIVIDPVRRIQQYIEAARAEGLQITAVTETHIHADFASGALALARKVGATLHVSGEGGPDWQYAFAHEPGIRTLHDGDVIEIGCVKLGALHTPGHTPEHLTFLVTDAATSAQPFGAFTGDFLFVGDVGRPDLLQRALGEPNSAAAAASRLFLSVRGFAQQPDWLLLFPGHGAGSACGKRLGGAPVSSLGYEKLTNWAFRVADEEAFGRSVLEDQPDPPRYFAEMKRVNRTGAPRHRATRELHRLTVQELDPLVTVHGALLDLRPNAATAGYLPGSIAIPLGRQFLAHAGSLLRYGMPVFLVAHDAHEALDGTDALSLIGLDDVRGWIPESVVASYARDGGALEQLVHVDAAEAERRQRNGEMLLDVRSTREWRAGHMSGAIHMPLTGLLDAVREIDRDLPVVVYCQAGARSTIAATALRRVGFTRVANMAEGYAGYVAALQPVASSPEPPEPGA